MSGAAPQHMTRRTIGDRAEDMELLQNRTYSEEVGTLGSLGRQVTRALSSGSWSRS